MVVEMHLFNRFYW